MPLVGASETRPKLSVPTVDALSGTGTGATRERGVDTTPFSTGDWAFVTQLYAYFMLDNESNDAADGITILLTDSARISGGKGRWKRLTDVPPDSPWLLANAIFISDGNGAPIGSDMNDGLTPATPIEHWAEAQRRWGEWTTLSPVGGVLTITVLSKSLGGATGDERKDPATFRNFLASGCAAVAVGTEQPIVADAVANVVTNKDRATNTPWQITTNAFTANQWANYINRVVKITVSDIAEGSKAYVARDMGSKTGHLTEWAVDVFGAPNGFLSPGAAPNDGDHFAIVDYTTIEVGNCTVGYLPEANAIFGFLAGGLTFKNFRVVNTGEGTGLVFPQAIGNMAETDFSNCIIDTNFNLFPYSTNGNAWNCCFTQGGTIYGNFSTSFGLVRPNVGTTFITMTAQTGANWIVGGDLTWVGPPPDEFGFGIAGLSLQGATMISGPQSFWDETAPLNTEAILVGNNSTLTFQSFSPFDSEDSYQPLWGSGNETQKIGLGIDANIDIHQNSKSGVEAPLPSIVLDTNPIKFNGPVQPGAANESDAYPWDVAAGAFTAPLAFTWALLEVAGPLGFWNDTYLNTGIPPATEHLSSAQNPAARNLVFRESAYHP